MFRPMRRGRQQLGQGECEDILRAGSFGTLALSGDEGYPYAVPISYVYSDGAVFFHCARSGHKLDAVRRCDKASFCVVGMDDVVPEKFTTRYKSVIAFGRISVVDDAQELYSAAAALARRYAPQAEQKEIDEEFREYESALCVLRLDIEHMTGKQGKELME